MRNNISNYVNYRALLGMASHFIAKTRPHRYVV